MKIEDQPETRIELPEVRAFVPLLCLHCESPMVREAEGWQCYAEHCRCWSSLGREGWLGSGLRILTP